MHASPWPGNCISRALWRSHAGGGGYVATLHTPPWAPRRPPRPQVRRGAGGLGMPCANASASWSHIDTNMDQPTDAQAVPGALSRVLGW